MAEAEPLSIIAFPDFRARAKASTVTLGLPSYIIAITPMGTVIFVISSPFSSVQS